MKYRIDALNKFAPITGAWIETLQKAIVDSGSPSHLSRVRGLKHVIIEGITPLHFRTYHGCVD